MRGAVVVCTWLLVLAWELGGGDLSPGSLKFVVFPSETILHEGRTLTLTCKADGPPQASIPSPSFYEWVKDGKVMPSETGQTLTIERLSGQDDGDYQCGPQRSDVNREVFHLDVIRGERSPLHETIFYADKHSSNLLGRTATLRCYFFGPLGIKHASYVWVKDGQVIPGATERDIHFRSLSSSDTGDYQCADPSMDVPRRNYHLEVITKLPRPDIYKDRQPACGHPFFLSCFILAGYTTTSETEYTWYKDSTEIKGQTGQRLQFDNVTEADTGKYTCTARDGPMDTTSPHSQAFDLIPLIAPEVSIKPTNPDSVVKGIQGENMTFTCVVTKAYPRVPYDGYSWSFLPSHHGQAQVLLQTNETLTLDPLTRNHSGQYTCQARNNQDYETVTLIGKASVTLDVVYLKSIFLTPDQSVNEGDRVTLTCSVESHPTAQLAWFVNGQEVRHVIDNQDHYFISKATCSDSGNYTCTASNADIRNVTKHATTNLVIQCDGVIQQEVPTRETILADVSAPLDFSLPDKTTTKVVHPSGQDMVIIFPNCSFLVSSEFRPRCLHTHCDSKRHIFFFTFIQVSERDEGLYTCENEGKQGKELSGCSRKLTLKRQVSDEVWHGYYIWLSIGVTIVVFGGITGIALAIKYRRIFRRPNGFSGWEGNGDPENVPLISLNKGLPQSEIEDLWNSFKKLYQRGRLYVFPKLFPSEQKPTIGHGGAEYTSASSPSTQDSKGTAEDSEYAVMDRVRFVLQNSVGPDDLPSFLLHNTSLSKTEKIVLVLSRKLGIVLMCVKTLQDRQHLHVVGEALSRLSRARKAVIEELTGLVKPEAIAAVLALPNLLQDDEAYLKERLRMSRSQRDIKMLFGMEQQVFKEWAEQLRERPESDVWEFGIPGDNAFMKACSKFLTLAGSYEPGKSRHRPTEIELRLLSPAQMEVRDSPAKLVHMWGPPGEGKTTLLIHTAIRWLGEGKAVVAVVSKHIYSNLISIVMKEMVMENHGKHPKLRICHTRKEMEIALKELIKVFPNDEICVITGILHWSGMLQSLLAAVKSKQVTAALSMFSEGLSKIDHDLSLECSSVGWENVHLPQHIGHPENTENLLNVLMMGSSDKSHVNQTSILCTEDKSKWNVIDHCMHEDFKSEKSCRQCEEELTPALPSTRHDASWDAWVACQTGDPSTVADLQSLCNMLQGFGVPDVYVNEKDKISAPLPAANMNMTRTCTVPLRWVYDVWNMKKEGVLVVHLDDRDIHPDFQRREDRDQRREEHKQQWVQAALSSTGQVVLLLLTPSPARSLLSLPDPGVVG